MSNISIGIRIPINLHKRLEVYIAETHLTKTEVILNALAQYLDVSDEIPLDQRVKALEAQMLELKSLVKNTSSTNISAI
ncbi:MULTISPECIES: DNA-binding domain-containing protein [Calothrix]|uniref:DNA-binding domain-containing protein n=2 Tax=Calothrix TaxID=1186 RepID=A0ABR8AN33_9CYAN|nr:MULTISPECIES: DNA-binding domain-containing protein [Calothrix]MBD2200678.1 DNA-binding domain-containing protein [Calothrix parietina FACHB-288]MBD2229741.1 DNA-binding domain-containing protein [Calothrix anomala FACHB-343]